MFLLLCRRAFVQYGSVQRRNSAVTLLQSLLYKKEKGVGGGEQERNIGPGRREK